MSDRPPRKKKEEGKRGRGGLGIPDFDLGPCLKTIVVTSKNLSFATLSNDLKDGVHDPIVLDWFSPNGQNVRGRKICQWIAV